jgi:hypothetical protein
MPAAGQPDCCCCCQTPHLGANPVHTHRLALCHTRTRATLHVVMNIVKQRQQREAAASGARSCWQIPENRDLHPWSFLPKNKSPGGPQNAPEISFNIVIQGRGWRLIGRQGRPGGARSCCCELAQQAGPAERHEALARHASRHGVASITQVMPFRTSSKPSLSRASQHCSKLTAGAAHCACRLKTELLVQHVAWLTTAGSKAAASSRPRSDTHKCPAQLQVTSTVSHQHLLHHDAHQLLLLPRCNHSGTQPHKVHQAASSTRIAAAAAAATTATTTMDPCCCVSGGEYVQGTKPPA